MKPSKRFLKSLLVVLLTALTALSGIGLYFSGTITLTYLPSRTTTTTTVHSLYLDTCFSSRNHLDDKETMKVNQTEETNVNGNCSLYCKHSWYSASKTINPINKQLMLIFNQAKITNLSMDSNQQTYCSSNQQTNCSSNQQTNCSSNQKTNCSSQQTNCNRLSYISPPGPRTALASFPGSGNTWVRHLLQQATGE